MVAAVRDGLRSGAVSGCRVVAGFDGFIDEMISVVRERRADGGCEAVATIGEFASLLGASAGHSSLREIRIPAVHPGGCTVNLADGLAALGVGTDVFATVGTPVHPAFSSVAARCRSFHAWGPEPGRTLAFEFDDGKLMFSSVEHLAGFDAALVQGLLTDGVYRDACEAASLIALTNWTLYPGMSGVWELLGREVFAKLPRRARLFFDLVDPSARAEADIRGMLRVLSSLAESSEVTLGLNIKEAGILCGVLGLGADADPGARAAAVRSALGLCRVVVHQAHGAVSATSAGVVAAASRHCAKPLKSTGAGDRFNAGFCTALALGWDEGMALVLGAATAGFFVRHARSAGLSDLDGFLGEWLSELS
jgi:sugar/nucleoside kinase (ribokinase family)